MKVTGAMGPYLFIFAVGWILPTDISCQIPRDKRISLNIHDSSGIDKADLSFIKGGAECTVC